MVPQRFVGPTGLSSFTHAVGGSLVDQVVHAPSADRFEATLVDVALGDARLVSARIGPLAAERRADPASAAAGSVFLLLARRGRGRITHRAGTGPIGPDRLVVVPGGEPFAVEYPAPSSLLFVALPAARVARTCPALDGPVRSVPLGSGGRPLAGQLPHLMAAVSGAPGPDGEELAGVLDSLLHLLLRRSVGDTAGDPLVALRVAAERLAERHLDDPALSVPWLAGRLAVSVRQLHRAFATGGRTPAEHVRTQRLRACGRVLAAAPDATVADVAARYGFASASHLGAWFRRTHGVTPAEWRARHAADRYPAGT
ncbi:AraC family transcriptional regulator [Geodermatophilus sp. DSM 44513]|uniref:AraC family transcriptional regulator n=1 Tax=Geodermatophilus sp. DSM 44513 TaxID=1528104 RepID=UPI001282C140|nr:AraC family transcriptional regulator [Geodermatophilus sp. DSM 44513]WNV75788.1 AraC family transcriptional regulator [Geodermatophilus sp. DSM 44513]